MNVTRPMIGLALLGIGIVLITVKVYLAVYKKRANRKLAEGISGDLVEDKPMISPIMVGIVTFLATVTIVYLLMIILVGIFSKASRDKGGTPQPYIHHYSLTEEDRKGTVFEGAKVGEPIAGYNMYTEQQGDIKFIYYVNKMPYAHISPQLLVAEKYTGSKNIVETADNFSLSDSSTFGSYGGEYDPECLTAISIDNFTGTLSIEYGVFDAPANTLVPPPEEKDGNMVTPSDKAMEYVCDKATLEIDWSRLEDLAYAN